jgi:hypothetical protein
VGTAGEDIRKRLEMLAALPWQISSEQARALVPELESQSLWVSDAHWTIGTANRTGFWSEEHGRMEVYMGAALVHAPLDRIRRHGRDFAAYLAAFTDDYECVFPVEGTYTFGGCGADAWVYVEVFGRFKQVFGCPSHDGHLHMLEHWSREHLVVEYYDSNPDSLWLAGRDTWFEVRDKGELKGWLVVMELGFDIGDCWDRPGDVQDSIRKNLEYTKKAES